MKSVLPQTALDVSSSSKSDTSFHSRISRNTPLRILHLEDDPDDAELMASMLMSSKVFCAIKYAKTKSEFETALDGGGFELIVSDYTLPGFSGIAALEIARERCPEVPFVFVSGTIGEDRAIEALRQGATDYVIKDRPNRLVPALLRAVSEAEAVRKQREAEAQIHEMEAQLLRNQRTECIGALAGGIAHDLNNVLTPLMVGTGMLKKEGLSSQGVQMLQLMETSVRHGMEMIRQILTFSRGVGGPPAPVSIRHLALEMLKFARRTFPRTITIRTEMRDHLHLVNGNATQLHQVLLNLCVNARDAMPKGGELLMEAENVSLDSAHLPQQPGLKPGDFVLLKISDTGHGMSPEILQKIFEPFFTTKESGRGTGLGLSTVISIVKTHGGFMDVTSEVGRGTTFKVYLPAQSSESRSLSANSAAAAPAKAEAPRTKVEAFVKEDLVARADDKLQD